MSFVIVISEKILIKFFFPGSINPQNEFAKKGLDRLEKQMKVLSSPIFYACFDSELSQTRLYFWVYLDERLDFEIVQKAIEISVFILFFCLCMHVHFGGVIVAT